MKSLNKQIHVWYSYNNKITDNSLLSIYENILNQEEMIQYQKFVFDKDRKQYLVTRAMLRYILSLYVKEVLPEEWVFRKSKYGKPFIVNSGIDPPIFFNISHTSGLICIVISKEEVIGIDAENIFREIDYLEIAKSFFSPIEFQNLAAYQFNKNRRFYDIWTLKEAYIKARGLGLSIPLNHFYYTFTDEDRININFKTTIKDNHEFWQFWQFKPDYNGDHIASIALKTNNKVRLRKIYVFEVVPFLKFQKSKCRISEGTLFR